MCFVDLKKKKDIPVTFSCNFIFFSFKHFVLFSPNTELQLAAMEYIVSVYLLLKRSV